MSGKRERAGEALATGLAVVMAHPYLVRRCPAGGILHATGRLCHACPSCEAGGIVLAMTTPISNDEIVELFNDMAAMLEIKGDSVFKIRAYQRAANTIEQLSWSLAAAAAAGDDLRKIPGVGKAISEKVQEYVATGHVAAYDRLAEEVPPNVLGMLEVPGMGPKTVKAVVEELGIGSVGELEQAALDGRLAQLPRMGKKSVENILRHIRAQRMRSDRTPLGIAAETCAAVSAQLFDACPGLVSLTPAGSLRRWEETIGDLDLIAVSDNPGETGQALASLPSVREVLVHGDAKTSVVVDPGIQIDLRAGEPDGLGAMLQYFTGSQQHKHPAARLRQPARAVPERVRHHRDGKRRDGTVPRRGILLRPLGTALDSAGVAAGRRRAGPGPVG